MVKVLEILPGNRAIVSTEGLYRVVIKKTGEVAKEFAEPESAARLAEFLSSPDWNESSEVVPYKICDELVPAEEAEVMVETCRECGSDAIRALPYRLVDELVAEGTAKRMVEILREEGNRAVAVPYAK